MHVYHRPAREVAEAKRKTAGYEREIYGFYGEHGILSRVGNDWRGLCEAHLPAECRADRQRTRDKVTYPR